MKSVVGEWRSRAVAEVVLKVVVLVTVVLERKEDLIVRARCVAIYLKPLPVVSARNSRKNP